MHSTDDIEQLQHDIAGTSWRLLPTEQKRALLARLRELNNTAEKSQSFREFQTTYHDDPAGFGRDAFLYRPNEELADYQYEILEAFGKYHRAAIRGPHGLGKTTLASIIVLWGVLTSDDVKIATTASVWRQLKYFLWPEIHKWARLLNWELIGRRPFSQFELLQLELKLSPMQLAFAVASNDPSSIEGAHAERMIYIFDESKAIADPMWDAAEGAFSSAGRDTHSEAYAFSISTPGQPAGRFYDIHTKKPGLEDWWTRHVTLTEAIQAGRISQEWADARKAQWGENNPIYINRVKGEFAASDEQAVIPLAWVEMAVERWYDLQAYADDETPLGYLDPDLRGPFQSIGVDVGLSHDLTVLAIRFGNHIDTLQYHGRENPETATMITAGRVAAQLNRYGREKFAIVDTIGIGAGVVHRLKEQKYKIVAFNAGAGVPVTFTDRSGTYGFVNKRSAAWWTLREYFDPTYGENIAVPPDDRLLGDLTAPQYSLTSGGKIKVETKQDVYDRIGRSTDAADAVMQAFWKEPQGIGFG